MIQIRCPACHKRAFDAIKGEVEVKKTSEYEGEPIAIVRRCVCHYEFLVVMKCT